MYRIANNKLIFKTGEPIVFKYPIKQSILVEDIIILILDIPAKEVYKQNVFGIKVCGDFLWQIGVVELFQKAKDCPYIDMQKNDANQIVLFNWCDTAIIINPKTGEVIDKYNTK
jgi:hypothetical protein